MNMIWLLLYNVLRWFAADSLKDSLADSLRVPLGLKLAVCLLLVQGW
jgi:hypothetical protein